MSKPELDTLIEAIKAGQISTDIIMTAFGHGWDDIRVLAAFDGDLMAVVQIIEAVLPGWDWTMDGGGQAAVWPPGTADQQNAGMIEADIEGNPARALLLAILMAMRGAA